jgi:hypothetical protein
MVVTVLPAKVLLLAAQAAPAHLAQVPAARVHLAQVPAARVHLAQVTAARVPAAPAVDPSSWVFVKSFLVCSRVRAATVVHATDLAATVRLATEAAATVHPATEPAAMVLPATALLLQWLSILATVAARLFP